MKIGPVLRSKYDELQIFLKFNISRAHCLWTSKQVIISLFLIFFNPELSFLNVFALSYEFIAFQIKIPKSKKPVTHEGTKKQFRENKIKNFNCIQLKLRASDGYLIIKSNSKFTVTNVKSSRKLSFRVILKLILILCQNFGYDHFFMSTKKSV